MEVGLAVFRTGDILTRVVVRALAVIRCGCVVGARGPSRRGRALCHVGGDGAHGTLDSPHAFRGRGRGVPLLDRGLGVFGRFARLRDEPLDGLLVRRLRLQPDSSLFAL